MGYVLFGFGVGVGVIAGLAALGALALASGIREDDLINAPRDYPAGWDPRIDRDNPCRIEREVRAARLRLIEPTFQPIGQSPLSGLNAE